MKQANLRERIVIDPKVLCGKAVVKGTRLSVDFLLELLGRGWTEEMVLENYPMLKKEDLKAVFKYAAEALREEEVLPFPKKARSK